MSPLPVAAGRRSTTSPGAAGHGPSLELVTAQDGLPEIPRDPVFIGLLENVSYWQQVAAYNTLG